MSAEKGFSLLALPPPAILAVFSHLTDLIDSVNLSLCCKELWDLGQRARRRSLCCAACGHALLDAAAAFSSDTFQDAPRLDLPDGDSYPVDVEHVEQRCKLSVAEHTLESGFCATLLALRAKVRLHRAGDPGHEVRAQHVQCAGCGLHLGLRVVQLGKLRFDTVHSDMRHWRELQVLGVCFLARPYLRLCAPSGREEQCGRLSASWLPPTASTPYRCTAARSSLRKAGQCGAVLFEQRDILSKEHCWDAGGGPERAFYINTFRPGAVVVSNARPEVLCQGEMVVGDVHCATCGARIGWRFCADLTPALSNCNQVGRYGVVQSSIQRG